MAESKNTSRQRNTILLLYEIVVLAAFCSMMILSLLLSPANIVLAQEEEDEAEEEDDGSPITETTTGEAATDTTAALSGFNFAAAGDWDCTSHTEDTVNNMLAKNPELVLGLGDYSYGDSADCWFDITQPIDNIMKISIGNHETGAILTELMEHFGLSEQYYSFDYQNVHFIALSTEEEYLDMSNDKAKEQLAFVQSDLEKASSNPNIDWIIPFFHRIMYPNCVCGPVDPFELNIGNIYHPLFEKYGVNLVLNSHTHTYERTYPLRINSEDSEAPIVTSNDLSNYRSVDGLVIATVGTGGAKPTNTHIADGLAAVQYENLFGFLNIDVSADGTKLVGTFYDNSGDGEIKDQFTITKSSVTIEEEEDDDDQIGIEDELEDESEDVDGEDEVSIAASDEENGNEEFSEDVDEDDDDNIGFDIDDSILEPETSFDEE